MADYSLPASQLTELRAAHRRTRDKREADRIKAVVLLASGRTAEDVADALLIDPNTVRNYFKRYQRGGLPDLLQVAYRGSDCELDAAQLAELDAHLQTELYLSAKDVAAWVEESLVLGSRFTLHASSPRSVTLAQLRFTSLAVASLREDLHLQECARAGRTKKKPGGVPGWNVSG